MRVCPRLPAYLRHRPYLVILLVLVVSALFCGAADAFTTECAYPSCWVTPYIMSSDWTGGDLGDSLPVYECSGNWPDIECDDPFSGTFTYTITIPATVNLSRVFSARIGLDGWVYGDCSGVLLSRDGDRFDGKDLIRINGKQYTDCPFNQPMSKSGYSNIYDWEFDIAPADLHPGVNTVTYEAYGWGNKVTDIYLYLEYMSPPPPELIDLSITPEIFVTRHDITVKPSVRPGGPDWEINDISYHIIDQKSGNLDYMRVMPDTGDFVYTPAAGAYGKKWLIARLHATDRMSHQQEFSEIKVPITIWFEKGNYPDWVDDDSDGQPNWFEYWRDDAAVPLLDNTVQYNGTESGWGEYFSGMIYLYSKAATMHYDDPLVLPTTTLSPGGESFGGPSVTGIDCAAEVLAHENMHKWIADQWKPGGEFYNKQDSDYDPNPVNVDGVNTYYDDSLPDFYEENVSKTNWWSSTDTYELRNRKGPNYFFYGDEEYMCMREGDGKKGVESNDWGYPGKQAGGRIPGLVLSPPAATSCTGKCDTMERRLEGTETIGTIDAPADADADGLFDTLSAAGDISVVQNGTHEIVFILSRDSGSGPEVISIQRNQSSLEAGNYSVTAVFPGTDISSSAIDGPYTATVVWRHEYQENSAPPSKSWQTAPYLSSKFEKTAAVFAGPASASPAGSDLQAAVPVTINAAGSYTLEGYLEDPVGTRMAYAKNTAAYATGSAVPALIFDGDTIAAYDRDGTYNLSGFRLLDDSGTIVDRLEHAGTVEITAGEFGTLVPIVTNVTDFPSSPNDDGRNETLSFSIGINASENSDYFYSGSLFDANNNLVRAIDGGAHFSDAGTQVTWLNISGKQLFNTGSNGSYTLRSFEIHGPSGYERRALLHTTRPYNFTQFAQPTIVILGNLTDYPVDNDGDGLYDAIVLGFDVEVGNTGCDLEGCGVSFPFTANLTGPGGKLITIGGSIVRLDRLMTHHVTLDFPGTTINGTLIDGPFAVEDLHNTNIGYPNYYHQPYSTGTYRFTGFEPSAILTGRIQNESGFPLGEVGVSSMGETGVTNNGGYYRLIYGESTFGGVGATPPADSGLSYAYQTVSVSLGNTTWRNFTLFKSISIHGRVTAENGTPLTSGTVAISGPSSATFNLNTWNNGSYAFTGKANGTYRIWYIPPIGSGLVGNNTYNVVTVPGQDLSWDLGAYAPRSLSGVVRDIDGLPVEEAEVSLTEGPVTVTWPYAPDTDAAGSYAFSSLVPGTYTVYVEPPYGSTLVANTSTVTIAPGDSAVTHDIFLEPAAVAPTAWFPDIDPTSGAAPLTVTFTDNSKGYPTAWLWDFGDGGTSTEKNPVHTYTTGGSYTLTLTVTNAHGSDTAAWGDSVQVLESRVILPNATLDEGGTGTFPLAADDLDGAAAVWMTMEFDPSVVRLDGVVDKAAGIWSVETSIDNTTGIAIINISFTTDRTYTSPTRMANLSFTATGSPGSTTILTADPVYQIACSGGEGCWPGATLIVTPVGTTNGSVTILGGAESLPVAGFTATPRNGTAPLSVTFDSSSSNVLLPTGYLWAFGDGSTSTLQNPGHTYAAPGFYNVSLRVSNISGSGSLTREGFIAVSAAGTAETYEFVTEFGHEGSGSGSGPEFNYPEGIAIHPSGNLYITDSGNYRVQVISPEGTFISAFGSEGSGNGQFTYPLGIAADTAGNVYVGDVSGNRIQKFDAAGSWLTGWGAPGTGNGQFSMVGGVASDADGMIYVMDIANARVQKFDPDGTFLTKWGSAGSGPGQFTDPFFIAADGSSAIYTTERSPTHRVQKFDLAGSPITAWGGGGTGAGLFDYPAGIAVDSAGDVYVADNENHRVQKFRADGQFVTEWGSAGSGTGQFAYPEGIAVSADDRVFIVDAANHRIQVFRPCSSGTITAGFTANTTTGEAPLHVKFTDTSAGSPTEWNWSFGDGEFSGTQNPDHTYNGAGTYTVQLTVTGTTGSDTLTRTDYITVTSGSSPAPVAAFSADITSGIAPLTVQFTDQSTNSPIQWNWSFGDGNFSTLQSPSHVYEPAGTFTVILNATNADGSDTETKTDYITVTASVPPAPVAAFTADVTSGTAPLTVQFTDQSTNSPTQWNWSFGDGNFSILQNPLHVYEPAGTYTVTLNATNAGGFDLMTRADYITVTGAVIPAPVAAFTADVTNGTAPLSVQFTDQSTGSPTEWNWSFGDGNFSILRNPLHVYEPAGTYTVTLNATNAGGSDQMTRVDYINVTGEVIPAPIAAFTATPTSGTIPLTVTFTDTSANAPTAWNWSFGDGNFSSARHPVYTYPDDGLYTVSLNASSSTGYNISVRTNYINATYPRPVIASVTPSPVLLNSTISFAVNGANFDPAAGMTRVNFTMGAFDNTNITITGVTPATINGTMVIGPTAPAGKWNVTVTTTKGGPSAVRTSAVVVSPAARPVIGSVRPATAALNTTVNVSVSGSNFDETGGMTRVNVTRGTFDNANITITDVTTTMINFTIVAGPGVPTGPWDVIVTTVNGGSSLVRTGAITVSTVPAPAIASLSPAKGARNTTVNFTITGTNFQAGAGKTRVRIYEDVMDTELDAAVTGITPTTIKGTVSIDGEAYPGDYIVEVNCVDGGTAAKAAAFTIGYLEMPAITSMTPSSGFRNDTVQYVITGSGFQPGLTTVLFRNQTTNAVFGTSEVSLVTGTRIIGNLTIPADAPTGQYRLDILTVDGGTVSRRNAFRADAVKPPVIGSLTPSTGAKGSVTAFTLTGSNFMAAEKTTVRVSDDVTGTELATDLFSVTQTKIIGSFTIPASAPSGKYRLTVSTTDGGETTRSEAFTVSYLERPVIGTLTPATGARNSNIAFTLTGDNFVDGGTIVRMRTFGSTINATALSVNTTKITGEFPIPADAGTGAYRLDVITQGGGFNSKLNAFTMTAA